MARGMLIGSYRRTLTAAWLGPRANPISWHIILSETGDIGGLFERQLAHLDVNE